MQQQQDQAKAALRRRQQQGRSEQTQASSGSTAPEILETPTTSAQACGACAVALAPSATFFTDDGPRCAACFSEEEAGRQDVGREVVRGPLQSASLSLAASALFWTPMAGVAFTALGWVLALHALRESVRMTGKLREQDELSTPVRLRAALGGLLTVAALVGAGFATRGLMDLLTVLPYVVTSR